MKSDHSLPLLVGSRICHDLVSPLGAIGNGLELIMMSGVEDSPELSLLSESIESASARLQFFRIAFGHAAPGQAMRAAECQQVLDAYFAQGRIDVDWLLHDDAVRAEVRLALLLVLCAEAALPRGGRIGLSCADGAWRLVAEGPVIMTDPEHWRILAGRLDEVGDLAAGKVQFALAVAAAEELGRRIAADTGGERLILSF
jgi:histidine phosphotransferase ChpT